MPAETTTQRNEPRRIWAWSAFVTIAAAVYFGWNLAAEPLFTDESAYIYHTYYWRLFESGHWNHVDWLHLASYDSPPLFKYLIGMSMQANGYSVPSSIRPAELWYQQGTQVQADPGLLWAARLPMCLGAVSGVLAIFLLGCQLYGTGAGLGAALLLATSPLYFTHARRAMADDLCVALMMFAYVLYLVSARDRGHNGKTVLLSASCGLLLGLAAAAKLTGLEATIVVLGTGTVATAFETRLHSFRSACRRWLLTMVPSVTVSGIVFFGINPYFWASPRLPTVPADGTVIEVAGQPRTLTWLDETRRIADMSVPGRFFHLLAYRTDALNHAKELFPDDVLATVPKRLEAVVVQGFGRWTAGGKEPLTRRLNLREGDSIRWAGITTPVPIVYWCWGYLLLASSGLVALGVAAKRTMPGRGAPIAAILPAVWMTTDATLLSRNLTLDWDRYYLVVVCYASLLTAIGITALFGRIRKAVTV